MIRFKFIFLFLILMLVPNIVFADDQRHIYFIDEFSISNEKISLEGYSFISHRDNYGVNSDGKGNLETYIVVYVGEWNDNYNDSNLCNGDYSDKCYSKRMSVKERDFFYSRCVGTSSSNENSDGCRNYSIVMKKADNWGYRDGINKKCDKKNDSDCMYYNVGFGGEIDLNVIFNKFANSDEIKFKIVSNIINKSDEIVKSGISDLGVSNSDSICNIDGGSCTIYDDATISSGDFSLKISGLSDKVVFDAKQALVRKANGAQYGRGIYFKEGVIYKVLSVASLETWTKSNRSSWTYEDRYLKLDSQQNGSTYVPCKKSNCNSNTWAPSNFVHVDGSFSIEKIEKTPVMIDPPYVPEPELEIDEVECTDIFGNTTRNNISVDCGDNGKLMQCEKPSGGITSEFYIRTDASCSGLGTKVYKDVDDNNLDGWYIKVGVSTDVLINQEAIFSFGAINYDLNKDVVYAGKGFGLNETTYTNIVTWFNAKSVLGNPYYSYSKLQYHVLDGDSCKLVEEDFKVSDKYYYYYYYNTITGKFVETDSLDEASFWAIDRAIREKIQSDSVDNIKFVSCDSNNSSSNCVSSPSYNVSGGWRKNQMVSKIEEYNYTFAGYEEKKFGVSITSSYKYSLANSYVSVKGDEYGKVLYSNDSLNINDVVYTGNKYYVDLRWIFGNSMPFNLVKNINPSFISDMDWTLNGVCNVNVKDGYYISSGDNKLNLAYKYRSISLDNSFPKIIPDNWSSWYIENINKNRIKNTYNNGIKYMIRLSKLGNNGTVKISDINTGTGYTSLVGFDRTGTSGFVDERFTIKQISGQSYCGLGYFYSDCDK